MNYDSRDVIKQIKKGIQFRNKAFGSESWKDVSTIITYEWGFVLKSLFYADFGDRVDSTHLAYAKSEMLDVMAQIDVLCQILGWDFDDLRRDGAEKFLTRMMEYVENNEKREKV